MPNGTLPPPAQFAWDTPVGDILKAVFTFSSELLDNPPVLIMLYADRLQVNWQTSGLTGGGEQSLCELSFTCRPSAPSSIEYVSHPSAP